MKRNFDSPEIGHFGRFQALEEFARDKELHSCPKSHRDQIARGTILCGGDHRSIWFVFLCPSNRSIDLSVRRNAASLRSVHACIFSQTTMRSITQAPLGYKGVSELLPFYESRRARSCGLTSRAGGRRSGRAGRT